MCINNTILFKSDILIGIIFSYLRFKIHTFFNLGKWIVEAVKL